MLLKDLTAEYIFNCKCRRLSPKTIRNYNLILHLFLDYLEQDLKVTSLEELTTYHIKSFIRRKDGEGKKPNYLNDILKVCKNFCKYLYEEQYTKSILTEKIKDVKKPKTIIKTFTDKQVSEMIKCYTGYDYLSMRNKLMLFIFFDTGIRLNELITLQIDQIKDDYIIIYGKGDKERVVPKSPFLSKWLFKYMTVRERCFDNRITSNCLFLSKNGKMLTSEAVERVVKKAGEFAMVNSEIRVSPHTCRHTFAQMQLKNGLDVYSLSRIMGHENISITQQYLLGLKDKEVIKAGMKTSPLMNLR